MKSKNGLKNKDLIIVAIFFLLYSYSICLFIIVGIAGMIPIVCIMFGLVGFIPFRIIYMYLRAKAPPKRYSNDSSSFSITNLLLVWNTYKLWQLVY